MYQKMKPKNKAGKNEDIVINKAIIFLPDDFKKLKLKGKWVLYIKKGLLTRLDKKKEKERKKINNRFCAISRIFRTL